MLLFLPLAWADDMGWQCAPDATVPEDVHAWKDATATQSLEDAWDLAWAWYDDACVTCASDYESEECEAIACVTSAGAVLDYHSTGSYEGGVGYEYEGTTTESITVSPPSETWSTLTVERESTSSSSSSSSGGGSESGSAAWTGVLRSDWPTDGSFTATYSSWTTWYGCGSSASWDDGACTWYASSSTENGNSYSVTMGSHWFNVRFSEQRWCEWVDRAFADGVYIGIPDEDTWAVTPDTDADGDDWGAAWDCDDADPTIYPCVTDPECDGIDQDCDGAAEECDTADSAVADSGSPADSATADTADEDSGAEAAPAPPPEGDRGCRAGAGVLLLPFLTRRRR